MRAVKRFLFVECTLFNQGVRGITPAIPLPPSTSCARSAARGGVLDRRGFDAYDPTDSTKPRFQRRHAPRQNRQDGGRSR